MNHQMAQHVQSQGRGEDTMLVHMTPNEVNSLQGLAMAHGGSLTINPETGLPEAGWLGKLLPTILGAIATPLTGGLINPMTASLLIGAGTGVATGSLKKGLMAGLQAYGGASMGSALGLNAGSFGIGAGANAASGAIPATVTQASANAVKDVAGQGLSSLQGAPSIVQSAAPEIMKASAFNPVASFGGQGLATTTSMLPSSITAATSAFPAALPAEIASAASGAGSAVAKTGLAGLAQRFGDAAKAGLPSGTPSMIRKAAPMLAASGLMQGVSGALARPGAGGTSSEAVDNSYQGPYYTQDRKQILDPNGPLSSKQRRFFDVDMPETYNTMGQVVQPGSHTARGTQIMQPVLNPKAKKGQPMYNFVPTTYMGGVDSNDPNDPYSASYTGYARGGEIELSDGAFVLDARTVSEIGNGSSNAGMEALRRIGGRPVQGQGDGVSDSVPARIGKRQPARVARDEVIVPADAVRRIGKGNPQRGADKLYALMDKAHKARKKAGRGQDTKLVRGLA
jgi:hypothetical protein